MKISACIIAKNEEENLPRLLESIKGKFDEIVLVDTGSTDRTVEIAKEYGCKVFFRKWNGFADARNYAVEKASGDWIWFFDADMELEEKEYERFLRILNITSKNNIFNGIRVIYRNIDYSGKIISFSSTVHIQKKLPELKWVGKIHERLVNEKGDIVTPPHPVYVNHYGYSNPNIMKTKLKRNLELLKEELKNINKETQIEEYLIKLFYLSQTYTAYSSYNEKFVNDAIKYGEEFLSLYKKKSSLINSLFTKHIYVYLLNSLINIKEYKKAQNYLEEALKLDENYPDYHYIKASLLEKRGEEEKAINSYIYFINLIDKTHISKSKDINIVSDYSHNIKFLIDEKLPSQIKDINHLKSFWKKEKGVYLGILLSNVFLKNGDKKNAIKVLDKLYKLYGDPIAGNKLAILLLDTDIVKAEKVLRKIQENNPSYSETSYNLSLLLHKKGKNKEALEEILKYTKRNKDPKGISLLYKLLKMNGFEKEAQKLEKNFTK